MERLREYVDIWDKDYRVIINVPPGRRCCCCWLCLQVPALVGGLSLGRMSALCYDTCNATRSQPDTSHGWDARGLWWRFEIVSPSHQLLLYEQSYRMWILNYKECFSHFCLQVLFSLCWLDPFFHLPVIYVRLLPSFFPSIPSSLFVSSSSLPPYHTPSSSFPPSISRHPL